MNRQRKLTTQRWVLALALPALLTISLVGCQPPPPPPPTATPILEPTPTQLPTATPEPPTPTPPPSPPPAPVIEPSDETTVLAGKKIPVRVNAPGADGYRWELQGDGEISGTEGEAILYTAPGPDQVDPEGTMALVIVVAYNEGGESPATTLVINVPPISQAPVIGNIAIRPAQDVVLMPKDCPIPGAQGELQTQGTISLAGLQAGQTYRLTLNGWSGEDPNDELCKIECTAQGEGFWDFDTAVTADENGQVSERPLRAFLPSDDVQLFPGKPYRVKFFVKDGTSFCAVLGIDDFWFTVEQQ